MPKIVQYTLPPGGTIVDVADNNPIALDIEQAGADYITVDTTNGSEQVIIGKLLTLEGGMAFSGATTFAIPDNTQNAFVIENATGGADYVNIDTRDGQEIVQLAVEGTAGLEVHVSSGNAEVRLADEVGFISDPDLMIRRRTTNELEFRIAGSDIFRVSTSGIMVETGSIEIETSSPTLTLDNSTAEDIEDGRESKIEFTGLRTGGGTPAATTLGSLQFRHHGTSDDNKSQFYLYTNDNSDASAAYVAMHVSAAGRVGIGQECNDNSQLQVDTSEGDIEIGRGDTSIVSFQKNGASILRAEHANGALQFDTGGSNARLYIDSDGKVGINESDPDLKVHIKASAIHEDVMGIYSATDTVVLRLECYDNNSGAVRIVGGAGNQHVLNGRSGSNGSADFNIQKYDCDFTASSSNSVKMLHIDASLDEVVIVDDSTGIGQEHLDETDFSSHAEWDVAGDFSDSGGDATYTHSSGSGTLTQVAADLAVALQGDRYYTFTYTVSAVTKGSGSTLSATITTGVAQDAVSLTLTNGTHKTGFRAKASPGDFVISAISSVSGDTFTLDNVSLKSSGGDLFVGERINCSDSGFNLRIGDVNTGAALAASTGTMNTCIGSSSGKVLTIGTKNVLIGYEAGDELTEGGSNVMIGYRAGQKVTTGAHNIVMGFEAGGGDGAGDNVCIGYNTLDDDHNGQLQNTAVGIQSLEAGRNHNNTAIGWRAGQALTTGADSIFIGSQCNTSAATANNQIGIGKSVTVGSANTCVIGNNLIESMSSGGDGVCSLGTASNGYKELYLKNAFSSGTSSTFDSKGIDIRKADDTISFEVMGAGGVRATFDDTNGLTQSSGEMLMICHTGDCNEHQLTADITTMKIYFYPAQGTYQTRTCILQQRDTSGGSAYTITYPSTAAAYTGYNTGSLGNVTIKWAGGVKHTMSTGDQAFDIVQFVLTHDTSGNEMIYASVIGQAYA